MKKILLLFSLLLILISGCQKSEELAKEEEEIVPVTIPYVQDNSFKIVAYMPSYKDPETVDISKYKMITHLFYAFLEINPVGDGSLNALSQQARFGTVQQRAKANNVKFGISITGASDKFVILAKSADARAKFVTNVVNFAKNNNLDGVDVDWEFPSTTTGIESADNYVLLMKELSAGLHKVNKFLSAAVTAAVYPGTGITNGIKPEVFPYVDFFNIMQYEGQNYDSSDKNQHAAFKMTTASLDAWLITKGLAKEKVVLGMPLYGKTAANGVSITSKGFREFDNAGLDVTADKVTFNNVEYWFNGINTIKQKVQLAKERANGIMFWEFSFDSNTSRSLIRAANDQLGRAY